MTYYDEQLKSLQQQMLRKRQLDIELKDLRVQRDQISSKVRELESLKLREQADVDRLEGRSLASFWYNVVGKMDEKLDQERQEAYAATVKYDAAARELAAVEDDIRRRESEAGGLRNCEAQYAKVLAEKKDAIKAGNHPVAAEILDLEAQLTFIENQKREIQEAIYAGRSAQSIAGSILSSLDSADGWNTWDMFGGGGIITHVAKHGHLDDAQEKVEQLQVSLRRFKTELADITIHADMQVSIDGFLRFADWFFDGLFADWAVMDRISQSKSQVQSTKSQIDQVLYRLDGMLSSAAQEQTRMKAKLDDLTVNTNLS